MVFMFFLQDAPKIKVCEISQKTENKVSLIEEVKDLFYALLIYSDVLSIQFEANPLHGG